MLLERWNGPSAPRELSSPLFKTGPDPLLQGTAVLQDGKDPPDSSGAPIHPACLWKILRHPAQNPATTFHLFQHGPVCHSGKIQCSKILVKY